MKRRTAGLGGFLAPVLLVLSASTVARAETLYWAGDPFINGGAAVNNDAVPSVSWRPYDDFVVPSPGWRVNEIWNWGTYGSVSGGTVEASVNWQIRQGMSFASSRVSLGTLVAAGSAIVLATHLGSVGHPECYETRVSGLDLELPPGTYFISIWPKHPNSQVRTVNPLRPGGTGTSGPSDSLSVYATSTLDPPFGISFEYLTGIGIGGTTSGEATILAGHVHLQDFSNDGQGREATIDLSQNGTLVETHTVTLGAGGSYSFATGQSGTFDVGAKGGHWLRTVKTGQSVVTGSTTTVDFSLINADVDGDNAVTVFDYAILSEYFDKTDSDADWTTVGSNGFAPVDADLDGDGGVTVFDYSILSANFDLVGD